MDILTNKNILLGITGSIAAYKAADIASRLKKEGCNTFGVEPTEAAIEAKKKGHFIFKEYFDKTSSKNIRKKIDGLLL